MNIAMFQEYSPYPSNLEGMAVIFGIIGLSMIAFSRGGGMLFIGLLVSLLTPMCTDCLLAFFIFDRQIINHCFYLARVVLSYRSITKHLQSHFYS